MGGKQVTVALVSLAIVALLVYLPVTDQHLTTVQYLAQPPILNNGLRKTPIWVRVNARDKLDPSRAVKRTKVTRGSRRILITGAAGFIGSQTALRFKQRGDVVVGIDNMNNYYDVKLKRHRAAIIESAGVIFRVGDLCSKEFLGELFTKYSFTHVIHLVSLFTCSF
jgi:FlaA1/EpsC-like NDP-sugar epimerase